MELSVIVPTYNRKHLLRRCMDSLIRQDYPGDKFEVIVVDDGSTDGTEESIKKIQTDRIIRYFRLKRNLGPATARNSGLREAKAEIITFIDDDIIASDKQWIKKIVYFHRRFSEEHVIQGGLLNSSGRNIFGLTWKFILDMYIAETMVIDDKDNTKKYIDVLGGANASFKKNILEELGGYNENLRVGEDIDLKYRLQEKGIKVLYVPEISATHFYRSNIFSFIKYEFKKGRGRYHLINRLKTKDNKRAEINLWNRVTFRKAYALYGIKAVFIFTIFLIKSKVSLLGRGYERLSTLK